MARKLSEQTIQEMRKLVLSGFSKYEAAKTLRISSSAVYYHTRDLPSKNTGNWGIRGKTLDVLKQLLNDGYVISKGSTSSNLHTIKKHFPHVKRAQVDGKSIYYLKDKNKQALEAMLKQKQSKIIRCEDISTMSTVFNIQLKKGEKQRFLGKKQMKIHQNLKTCKKKNHSIPKENDSSDTGFLGRFLHSEVLIGVLEHIRVVEVGRLWL